MKITVSLTAGMLIDQLPKREQDKVMRALEQIEQGTWEDLRRHRSIHKLVGELSGQFSYRVSTDLRMIFIIQSGEIHVLDVVRYDQLKRLSRRTGGDSSE